MFPAVTSHLSAIQVRSARVRDGCMSRRLRPHVEVVQAWPAEERALVGTHDESAAAVGAATGPRHRRDVVVAEVDPGDDATRAGSAEIREERLRAREQRELPA